MVLMRLFETCLTDFSYYNHCSESSAMLSLLSLKVLLKLMACSETFLHFFDQTENLISKYESSDELYF